MSIAAEYLISTAYPSTIGGTSGSLQYFFSQPPQSLWNTAALGVNPPVQSSQLGQVPSATSSLGMLPYDASGFKLQGYRFGIIASGVLTNTTGSPTATPVIQIVTPNVTTGSIYTSPVYTNLLMGVPSSVMTAGFPAAFSVSASLYFDPLSGTLSGTQTWQIVPKAAASGVNTQLGSSANYAILAAAGITNTGLTVVSGGVIGSSPTATETGFPPGVATIDNADAAAAQTAALVAYNFYNGLTFTSLGTAVNMSTNTGGGGGAGVYRAGNYSSTSSLDIPATVNANGNPRITLDAQGNPNALFVFKSIASTTTLEANAAVTLINGAQANNVIWIVGSSFTSVAPSTMVGNILANTSITLGGGTLNGRALAGIETTSGAVTISTATALTVPGSFPVTSSGLSYITPVQG